MNIRRFGVLVVHGIGDQKQFQALEEVARNLFRALARNPSHRPHMQVLGGDQVARRSKEETWREAPVLLRWTTHGSEVVELSFREVFWADLDPEMSWRKWLRLAWWALSMPGVRVFGPGDGTEGSQEDNLSRHGLRRPRRLSGRELLQARLELFAIAWVLCPVFVFLSGMQRIVLRRVGLEFENFDRLLYDYLGDVMLYQDWLPMTDRVEGFGEKARVAIRRRMVRALTRAGSEVERGTLHGFYVFAHSLGTVAAFNGLMESSLALPNYLTEEEWNAVPAWLKTQASSDAPPGQLPARPPWLGPRDAIDRRRLLGGLRGFLTIGSPLDKFASLWPAIVPINEEPAQPAVPWLNVHDPQDLVAGRIDLFTNPGSPSPGGGLLAVDGFRLSNHAWTGSWGFPMAHTSYWTTGGDGNRLVDRLIDWLEDPQAGFVPPCGVMPVRVGRVLLWFSLIACLPIALFVASQLFAYGANWLLRALKVEAHVSLRGVVVFAFVLVLTLSLLRRLFERVYWGRQR